MNTGLIHEMRAGDSLVIALPRDSRDGNLELVLGSVRITLLKKSGTRARLRVEAPTTHEVEIRNEFGRVLDNRALMEA